jgi:hypothetical protein
MPTQIVQKFEHMYRVNAGATGPPGPGTPAGPTDMEMIKWLYDVLTILDSKAGALLAFDGLLLAAEALMYDKMSEKIGWLHYTSLALIIITVVAALFCLFVARVSYAFLGRIDLNSYSNTAEIDELGNIIQSRTHRLWWAWGLSVIAVFLFVILAIFVLES